jgi:hypothetical protein
VTRGWIAGAALAIGAIVASTSAQQLNVPRAGYVYPAGGRQGSHLQVTVGGQFLDGAKDVRLSGAGVQARVLGIDKPLAGRELNDARERLQELQKNARDPAIQKELIALREKIGESLRRSSNPSLSELLTLDITIAADAESGTRSLRIVTATGTANPVTFSVGQLPEFRERDVKNTSGDSELPITLPAVVNGRIIPGESDRIRFPLRQLPQYMPGDVDRYRFTARKGQHLVIAVAARELTPYLADAVPGWFQAVVTIFDSSGHEVAYDDDYRFHPDPVLHYEIPADGEYVAEIRDALYRGREDFVYRMTIGELPFITGVFPLGGPAGRRTKIAVTGWNLPSRTTAFDARRKETGVYPIAVDGASRSNTMPFAVSDLPETIEREPNDSRARAQQLKLPAIVNGRIQQAGDVDVYKFNGREGQRIVAEVFARRLESPLDSYLELTDARGKRIAFNDDHEDKATWWLTHHADSYLAATLSARGIYFLRIGDVQHKGGAEYAYRLRLDAPRPDFELRVTPSAISIAGTVPVTVHALRKDGFDGEIALALKDGAGFLLAGGVVPRGQDEVRVTLTAPQRGMSGPVAIRLEGRATVDGRSIVREALPADDRMQAFAYHHLVTSGDPGMLVTGRGGMRAIRILTPLPLKMAAGSTREVRVELPPGVRNFQNVTFELTDPPEGIAVSHVTVDQTSATFLVQADGKAKPGLNGNLIVVLSGERTAQAQNRRRIPLATLTAMPFEIVP